MKVSKGEILMVTTGEYSDYGVQSLVVALADFDINELREEYLSEFPDQTERYSADFYKFNNWLVNEKKIVEEVKHREWHLGDYSSFEMRLK